MPRTPVARALSGNMLREGSHAPCRWQVAEKGTKPGTIAPMLAAQVHACRTLQRTTCTVRHATCAKPVRSSWCSQRRCGWLAWHGHGHGMQRRRDSGFTWAACSVLPDVRRMLHVACCMVCVFVCVLRSTVGAAIGCRLAALGVHSVATGRRRCPLHERVALVWLPCRRAAMRRSSPSWCSAEPKRRCRTPSGVLLDRAMYHAANTMQEDSVQADTVQRATGALDRAMCKEGGA
jgi:hypothetical protein